jgi:hypothetical protein
MIGAIILVAVLLLILGAGLASFFVRRHRETDRPEAGWRRTDEVFNDPSTNRVMRVWLDQRGERRYVAETERPAI